MDENVRDPDSGKQRSGFLPDVLDSSVIAFPLMDLLKNEPNRLHHVVIDLNLNYPGGREEASTQVKKLFDQAQKEPNSVAKPSPDGKLSSDPGSQYVYAELDAATIKAIVRLDREAAGDSPEQRAIFHVWPDFKIKALS